MRYPKEKGLGKQISRFFWFVIFGLDSFNFTRVAGFFNALFLVLFQLLTVFLKNRNLIKICLGCLEQVAKKLTQMVVCHGDFHPMGSNPRKKSPTKNTSNSISISHLQGAGSKTRLRTRIELALKQSFLPRLGPFCLIFSSTGTPRCSPGREGAPFKGCVFCWEIDVPIGVFQWCLDVRGSWYMVSKWRKSYL